MSLVLSSALFQSNRSSFVSLSSHTRFSQSRISFDILHFFEPFLHNTAFGSLVTMATQIPQQLQLFLGTQTRSQLATMTTAINEIQNSQLSHQVTATCIPASKHKAVKTSKDHGKSHRKMADQLPNVKPVAKRPLNSFMAFRSYYKAMFPARQQKDISGYLNQLWIGDPYRAKWIIIAKAYSVIRDTIGRHNTSLPQLLAIVEPHIGLIPPAFYPSLMGWLVPSGNEREMHRRFVPDLSAFPSDWQATTDKSVDDLLKICEDVGFYSPSPINSKSTKQARKKMMLTFADVTATTTNGELTMAVNANPPVVAQTSNVIKDTENININGSDNAVDTAALSMHFQTAEADNFNVPNQPLLNDMDMDEASIAVSSNVNPPVGAQVYNYLLDMSEDSYPYNDQFEPNDAANNEGLCFDFGDEFEDGGDIRSYDPNLDFDLLLNYNGATTD